MFWHQKYQFILRSITSSAFWGAKWTGNHCDSRQVSAIDLCFFEELFHNHIGLILLKKDGKFRRINSFHKYQRCLCHLTWCLSQRHCAQDKFPSSSWKRISLKMSSLFKNSVHAIPLETKGGKETLLLLYVNIKGVGGENLKPFLASTICCKRQQ